MVFGKVVKSGVLVLVLFAWKMAVYYHGVDVAVFSDITYWVTLCFFGASLILYRHCTDRARRVFRWGYLIFSVFLFVDIIYYNYFNQLVSVNQIFQIKNIKGTEESVRSAIPAISLLVLVDLPVLFLLRRKFGMEPLSTRQISSGKKRLLGVGLLVCISLIALNPFRISVFRKINSTEALTVHIKDVVDSTVGQVIYDHSSLGDILQRKAIPKDMIGEVAAYVAKKPTERVWPKDAYEDIGKGMNLIVIQVESLQDFVIGKTYNGQEITPFLNTLVSEDALYFNRFYTNMGKGNTSDAEFSMQTGLYPVIEGSCYDLYIEENDFMSLGQVLKEAGYTTIAAVGDDANFYNRAMVYEKLGYDNFYNDTNLDMDEISGLGLSDKSFFRQMGGILEQQTEPFYSFMLTVTNHYPYVLDPIPSSLTLKPEDQETLFGRYLQTVRYTDEALAQLFGDLKENGLYDHTVVVIYGDHHGLNCLDEENRDKMTEFLGYTYDYDEMLNVPLLIYVPGLEEAKTVETVGGQVDILPTLANSLDLDLTGNVILGQDLLNAKEGFVATVAYMLQGSFIKDDIIYQVGRDGLFESGRAWDLKTHQPLPLDGLEPYWERAVAVTEMSKYILEHNLAKRNGEKSRN